MFQRLSQIALLAAFAVAGAAHAQKAAETTNTPQRAGEASTMTGGVPNAQTSNPVTTPSTAEKAEMDRKSGATTSTSKGGKVSANKGSASETSNVPQRAGEASTMTGGAPNKKTAN